jgi:hypothetical protein
MVEKQTWTPNGYELLKNEFEPNFKSPIIILINFIGLKIFPYQVFQIVGYLFI